MNLNLLPLSLPKSALATLCLFAVAATAAPLDGKYVGTWKGECLQDQYDDESIPAQDYFVISKDKLVQYSYVFNGQKDCSKQPTLMTILEFKLEGGALTGPKQAQQVKTTALRIRVKALDVNTAIEFSKQKECKVAHWQKDQAVDCLNAEPYKSLMKGHTFEMIFHTANNNFYYKNVDEEGPSEKPEVFTATKDVPWR